MNNYPTSDLKAHEYSTRQRNKRTCGKCINAKACDIPGWRNCLVWEKAVKPHGTCKYFFED